MSNLKDVARLADVDPSTASRVLRSDPSQVVSTVTRDRILEAARTLQYRPNALARGLRTRRTDTIGLIIPNLDNVGFSEVTRGIQSAAAEAGNLVLVVEADALRSAEGNGEHYERLLTDGRVDGLIVAFATLEDRFVAQLAVRDLPLVLVNRRTAGVHGSVVVDDEGGTHLATRHLLELGHTRIGFIGLDADTDTARRREAGYRMAMAAAHVPVDDRYVRTARPTADGGYEAAVGIVRASEGAPPTALIAASLVGAIGVLGGLTSAGLRVPGDISVIAFNDHPLAAHVSPPLTTVRMPNFRMGVEAVKLLLRAVERETLSDVMIDERPELIVRASTAPPAR